MDIAFDYYIMTTITLDTCSSLTCNYSQFVFEGLCGNSNNDTTDDLTTSSGIIENSAQPFAQSWSVGVCAVNIPHTCINTDNGTKE